MREVTGENQRVPRVFGVRLLCLTKFQTSLKDMWISRTLVYVYHSCECFENVEKDALPEEMSTKVVVWVLKYCPGNEFII